MHHVGDVVDAVSQVFNDVLITHSLKLRLVFMGLLADIIPLELDYISKVDKPRLAEGFICLWFILGDNTMADLEAERTKAMKKATTSKTDMIQIANFIGCTGNEMISLDRLGP